MRDISPKLSPADGMRCNPAALCACDGAITLVMSSMFAGGRYRRRRGEPYVCDDILARPVAARLKVCHRSRARAPGVCYLSSAYRVKKVG